MTGFICCVCYHVFKHPQCRCLRKQSGRFRHEPDVQETTSTVRDRCHVCHRCLHNSTNTIKPNQAPPYHWQIGMMQCCFVISENTTVDLAFFRHQTSSSQHKNTASFGRALWKMHVCANNCKPKTQRLVTCSRAWRARENNSVRRQTRADRPSLKLTSWCAARHLLRAFSPSVALAGVWLERWDYEHIYCNGLAYSPISLLWLVKWNWTSKCGSV